MKILTFDVEDWFHILDNDSTKTITQWEKYESRLQLNLDKIFSLLDKYNIKGTFFCLGWIGKMYPEIVKKINDLGYEIACHSNNHQLVYEMTPQSFREDIRTSLDILQNLTGKKITVYRTPGFSLVKETKWVFDLIAEFGIETDCSIFPSNRGHGGFPEFKYSEPCLVKYNGLEIKELPINTKSFLNNDFVFSGGGYFRLLPYPLLKHLFSKSNYVMTYFHPRDFDPDQPMIKELSLIRKFKSYYGLKTAYDKLDKLLNEFSFIDIERADKLIDWTAVRKIELN